MMPRAVSKHLPPLYAFLVSSVLLLTIYRRFWSGSDSHDPYKCSVLLNEGRWLDEPTFKHSRSAFQKWQPPGCLLKEYKGDEISHCAEDRQLLFIGDSNVRQLFWAVAKKLDDSMSAPAGRYAERHGDIQLRPRGVDLRFVWDPYLNGSILANELEIYQESVLPAGRDGKAEVPAVMVVLGGGLWHARQHEAGAVREFKKSVDAITALTTRRDGSEWQSKAPFNGREGIGDQVFFMPVEEPLYKRLSPSRQVTILPEEVDQMNEYLHQLQPSHGLTIPWVNQVMTSQRPFAYEASGLHVVEPIVNRRADVILNLRCNAKMDNVAVAPYDRTCCSNYTPGNWLQWSLIAFAFTVSILATYIKCRESTTVDLESGTLTYFQIVASIASIALPLAYCFFADRTHLFHKVQKLYQKSEFLRVCGIALVIGILSMRKSQPNLERQNVPDELPSISKKDDSTTQVALKFSAPSNTLLSPAQILEWKGWTICFLLLAQYYAADQEPWLYIVSRLCISSLIFCLGYEHTFYFCTLGDYSLHRVAAVLVRMNMLAVATTYQMQTSYLLYCIAPLLSFWFLIVFITLRFGQELNGNVGFLLGKIGLSAALITLMHRNDQPINFIFDMLRVVFRIHWSGKDWRDSVSIDPFMAFVGMLVALATVVHGHFTTSARTKTGDSQAPLIQGFGHRIISLLTPIAILASLLTLPIFFYLTLSSFVESSGYNRNVHPYLAPLPILSFVCLRNSTQVLRAWQSEAFKRLGGCGFELSVLSMHAWNAADGRGVASLGVSADRRIDMIVLGAVVLGATSVVSQSCNKLTNMIMGIGDDRVMEGTFLPLVNENDGIASGKASQKPRGGIGGPKARFALLLGALWCLNFITP
ncbi:hypothetical protein FKW77_006634 [Venturia effusa]|uniref:Cas1p 10 TM acyl transferase domain-containing protein n=1 Tax=Venturia effusa TaxID=50376 RepID=A0A517LQD3_9PEZI|nr:hypothetical protein FKW77_006634 [Venturia effusa]